MSYPLNLYFSSRNIDITTKILYSETIKIIEIELRCLNYFAIEEITCKFIILVVSYKKPTSPYLTPIATYIKPCS